jgi:hypothetical protein
MDDAPTCPQNVLFVYVGRSVQFIPAKVALLSQLIDVFDIFMPAYTFV